MAGTDDPSARPDKPNPASESPDGGRSDPVERSALPVDPIPRSRSTLGMNWFSLGAEIMAIVVGWTLGGWFLGRYLPATWPVVVGSLLGVAHAMVHFLKSAAKP